MRDSITKMLVDHAFLKKSEEQLVAECDFAQEVYDDYASKKVTFDGAKIPLASALAKLPIGWVYADGDIKVQIAGDTVTLYSKSGLTSPWGSSHPILGDALLKDRTEWAFPPGQGYSTVAVFDHGSDVAKCYEKLTRSREDLSKKISDARISARATLNIATSIQNLVDMWPECATFANRFLTKEKVSEIALPTLRREELNATLELPVEEKS